jgi:hypothetical protein
MNEPPNPPNLPPSDSTPPPPPPPPFTPPPAPPEVPPSPPPPSPTIPPPKAPIYTPPAGVPPKKSSMPWILGGCGCLTLLLILALVIGFMVYRGQKNVTEFKRDFKSALKSIDEDQRTVATPTPSTTTDSATRSSKAGWSTYSNVKDSLPENLQSHFIAFSFDYPKTFLLQPQSKMNFVKIEKPATVGKDNTAENFAVGYASFTPPNAESGPLYEQLLDDLGKQIGRVFHNYKELTRIDETVAGVKSRATLFQADFNDAANTQLYGKTIVVHPPGKEKGVTILILGTSLSRDIRSAQDLGTKGDTAEILRSFKFL